MKVAVCSAQSYDRQFLLAANRDVGHELIFFDSHLCEETRQMVAGFPAVCVFVNDMLSAAVLQTLAAQGTRLIALRCAGFNNIDIQAVNSLGLRELYYVMKLMAGQVSIYAGFIWSYSREAYTLAIIP